MQTDEILDQGFLEYIGEGQDLGGVGSSTWNRLHQSGDIWFIYLNHGLWCTQESFTYIIGRWIGSCKTFPLIAGEEASMGWTWSHSEWTGERLLGHKWVTEVPKWVVVSQTASFTYASPYNTVNKERSKARNQWLTVIKFSQAKIHKIAFKPFREQKMSQIIFQKLWQAKYRCTFRNTHE